jgi:peroxiredoxin
MDICALPAGSKNRHQAPVIPGWMPAVLLTAAGYNILWGAWVVLFPNMLFDWLGAPRPNYPELWQCIGMIVGVYGIGYALAAIHPLRYWPMVLVGLLGKIFGPIGFAWALYQGTFPLGFGWNILTNDLIWWIPFFLILKAAYQQWQQQDSQPALSLQQALASTRIQTEAHPDGISLKDWSTQQPTLVLFLRHAGCTFCREALLDIAQERAAIEARGFSILLVHQSSPDTAKTLLAQYGLSDIPHLSDPDRELYRAFDLGRGSLGKLFGLNVWIRGVQAGILNGHGVGTLDGDGFQMPGLFLLRNGEIVKRYLHIDAADRPDYLKFVTEERAA